MAVYGVIRTDRLHGSDNGADLVSVRYSPAGTDTIIENGNVVLLGALDTSNREVFVGATPAADSAIGKIAIVAEPEVLADERLKLLSDFRNEAGAVVRAYRLVTGDVFSVSPAAVTAIVGTAPAIGQLVELAADTKLKLVATATSQSTQVGTVIEATTAFITILVA